MLYVVTEKKLGYENTRTTVLLLLPNFISMNNNSILLIFF